MTTENNRGGQPANDAPPKRALVYYRSFDSTFGGGEYLPLAFVAELQKRCRVTFALDWKSDVEGYAKAVGVDLDVSSLDIVFIKPENRLAQRIDAILPFYRTRQLKKLAKKVDICISTVNMFDFGKPAHHFVFLLRNFGDNAFFDYCSRKAPPSGVARLKRRFVTFVGERILRRILRIRSTRRIIADKREHIYPNSYYAERIMREFYGEFNSTVFYPPTIFEPVSRPPRDPLKVICLGRIQAEKRIVDIIDIVERARALSGRDITLHIAGGLDETDYAVRLRIMAAEKPWLTLHGQIIGKDKDEFLCSGTYAVHAMRNETFGISVTEYLKAGCITLAPDEGGACEIVNSPDLTFRTNDEAAKILTRLLDDDRFREDMRRHCENRAALFSRAAYMERQRRLLDRIVSGTDEGARS